MKGTALMNGGTRSFSNFWTSYIRRWEKPNYMDAQLERRLFEPKKKKLLNSLELFPLQVGGREEKGSNQLRKLLTQNSTIEKRNLNIKIQTDKA